MEWTIVGVLAAAVTFGITVAKPIITVTKMLAEMRTESKELRRDVDEQEENGKSAHRKLWAHNDKQDEAIATHEKRIGILEDRCKDCDGR